MGAIRPQRANAGRPPAHPNWGVRESKFSSPELFFRPNGLLISLRDSIYPAYSALAYGHASLFSVKREPKFSTVHSRRWCIAARSSVVSGTSGAVLWRRAEQSSLLTPR